MSSFFYHCPERSLLHGLPDLMTKVAAEELHKMNYAVSECNVIYYPQVIGKDHRFVRL